MKEKIMKVFGAVCCVFVFHYLAFVPIVQAADNNVVIMRAADKNVGIMRATKVAYGDWFEEYMKLPYCQDLEDDGVRDNTMCDDEGFCIGGLYYECRPDLKRVWEKRQAADREREKDMSDVEMMNYMYNWYKNLDVNGKLKGLGKYMNR
ncbi:MAG: hypothetical protein F6K30_20400 [Cyanothece sp. SIO2G6]|nr:hypothetical protein [Cyanothece sp. SIO2G6]